MADKNLQTLIKAAQAGGEVLRRYFNQSVKVSTKSMLGDFQTKADLESEESILKILTAEFPDYNIIAEESGETQKNSEYTLAIDPMDGTNNFVLGIPSFSVSIGLLYKGEAVMGVVYQPVIDQTYSAIKGEGAYLNGEKIEVSAKKGSKEVTLVCSFGYNVKKDYYGKIMGLLSSQDIKRVMNNWSVAFEYCLLASGKIESVFTDGVELHDYAAGKLIALEAGGKIVDFDGKEEKDYTNDKFIISNTTKTNNYILNIIKPLQSLTK